MTFCKGPNPEHFARRWLVVRLLANLLAWLLPNHKHTAVQQRSEQGRIESTFPSNSSIVCAFILTDMGTRDDEYDYLFKGKPKIHLPREFKKAAMIVWLLCREPLERLYI